MIGPAVIAALSLVSSRGQLTAERVVPDSSAVYSVVARISAGAMSPYCPGMTVATCPSPQAAVLQDSIKNLVVAGWSEAAIEMWLIDEFGEQVRGRPPWRGLGIVGWTLPYIVVLGGGAVLLRVLAARRTPADVSATGEVDPAGRALIEREMAKLKL